MRNIWRIIKADARSLFTHFFALAVALAIAVLPSLYAWLNIYSNWDPYGNTGNISIAVASLDKGWTEEDGTQVNKGREVVENLRSSTSINWVIVDTKEEAQHGVYAGDYYAAVVIGQDFSYNMYHMLTEWTDKPTITYYENYKKNAVATKITDTAVSSLKTTISKSYLDVVVDAIFRGANDLSDQLKGDDPVGSVQGLLGQARSLLRSCAQTVDAFQAAGQDNSSYRQDLSDLVSNINQNRPDGQEILDTVAQLNRQVHEALDKAQTALDKAFDAAEKFLNGIDVDAELPQIQEDLRDAAQTMDDMGDKLTAWARSIAVEAGPVGAEAAAAAQRLADGCYQLRDHLNTLADGLKENSALLQDTIALVAQLEKLTDTLLTPVFDDVTDDVKNVWTRRRACSRASTAPRRTPGTCWRRLPRRQGP
ncbi:MAG: YhgE/Pip family protein [Oscillospiraceae bacterium]